MRRFVGLFFSSVGTTAQLDLYCPASKAIITQVHIALHAISLSDNSVLKGGIRRGISDIRSQLYGRYCTRSFRSSSQEYIIKGFILGAIANVHLVDKLGFGKVRI